QEVVEAELGGALDAVALDAQAPRAGVETRRRRVMADEEVAGRRQVARERLQPGLLIDPVVDEDVGRHGLDVELLGLRRRLGKGGAAARRNRPPPGPADASTTSPSPKTIRAGACVGLCSGPKRTSPWSTYANAVWPRGTVSRNVLPGGSVTSMTFGATARPSTGPASRPSPASPAMTRILAPPSAAVSVRRDASRSRYFG